jgi:acid phosphatase (class A)
MKIYIWTALLACSSVLSGCASASRTPSSSLPPVSISIGEVLQGPPVAGSAAERADLQETIALQQSRTLQDCARAGAAAKPSLSSFFGLPAGPLTEVEIKRLDPYFFRILESVRPVIGKAKDSWSRPRPAATDSRVTPCLPNERSSSYPSGHAMLAAVFARSLSLVFPQRQTEILRRAEQIEEDRVLSGLHFRTDVQDGDRLGQAVAKQLESSSDYMTMVEEMRGSR